MLVQHTVDSAERGHREQRRRTWLWRRRYSAICELWIFFSCRNELLQLLMFFGHLLNLNFRLGRASSSCPLWVQSRRLILHSRMLLWVLSETSWAGERLLLFSGKEVTYLCVLSEEYHPLIWGLLVILDDDTRDVPGLDILFRGLCGYLHLRNREHSGAIMRNRTWQPESPTTIPSCWRKKAWSSIVFSLQRLQSDVLCAASGLRWPISAPTAL